MKTIIAGSRDIEDVQRHVGEAVAASGFTITEVVSGAARGVDQAGEAYAEFRGIPVVSFPANWEKNGRSAGYIRNKEMAGYAQALIAVWDGKSKGTGHMIDLATEAGLQVYVHRVGVL